MTTVLRDAQSLDAWWASLPTLDDHLSDVALESQRAFEREMLSMASTTSLLGKARKQFVRKILPNVELKVAKWGGVVRRLLGSCLARAISEDGREWLVQIEVDVWVIIRNAQGKDDRRVYFNRRLEAVISRDAVQNVLRAEGGITPDQFAADLARLFDVMNREARYHVDPDAVFKTEPVKIDFAIDETGAIKWDLSNPDESEEFLRELIAYEREKMMVSPTPTIMPFMGGGIIVDKRNFDLPLQNISPDKFAAFSWIPEAQMTPRMGEICDLWRNRLSETGVADWAFDVKNFSALILDDPLP